MAETERLTSGLYVVATPIGNLRDITLRALEVLEGADLILAEDTRVGAKLLAAHGISNRMQRYDEHAAARARPAILSRLAAGERIALTSDAGTPLVSDPGYRLVREAAAQGTTVIPVPGPSAVLAALSVSGLPTDRFMFAGFPPSKAVARRKFFAGLVASPATLVFFEGGSRLFASLRDMADVFGSREAVVARELTKFHETILRGSLDRLALEPALVAPKGEIVVLVAGGSAEGVTEGDIDAALADALRQHSPGEAAAEVGKALGVDRRSVYARALALKGR